MASILRWARHRELPLCRRYCWRCSYCLDSLDTTECPECGQTFNVDDPATYRTDPFEPDTEELIDIALGVVVYGIIGLVILSLVAAAVWMMLHQ